MDDRRYGNGQIGLKSKHLLNTVSSNAKLSFGRFPAKEIVKVIEKVEGRERQLD